MFVKKPENNIKGIITIGAISLAVYTFGDTVPNAIPITIPIRAYKIPTRTNWMKRKKLGSKPTI